MKQMTTDSVLATKGRGRPKKGFALLINCGPYRNTGGAGRKVHYLEEVLAILGQKMAEAADVESFYDIDAFTRRDQLAKVAPTVAEEFANEIVMVTGLGSGQSDMRVLVDALKPYAGLILTPLD